MIINQTGGGAGGIEWKSIDLPLVWSKPVILALQDDTGKVQPGRRYPSKEGNIKILNTLAIADTTSPDGSALSLLYGEVRPETPFSVKTYAQGQMYTVSELDRAIGAVIASTWNGVFPKTFSGKGVVTISLRDVLYGGDYSLIEMNVNITEGIVSVSASLPAYVPSYNVKKVSIKVVELTLTSL